MVSGVIRKKDVPEHTRFRRAGDKAPGA